jgi:hypothetical protein
MFGAHRLRIPRPRSTNWNAETGESGAGSGNNFDPAINDAPRLPFRTSGAVRKALIDRLIALTSGIRSAARRHRAPNA